MDKFDEKVIGYELSKLKLRLLRRKVFRIFSSMPKEKESQIK